MGNISVGIDTSKDRGKRSKGRRLIGVVIGKPSAISKFTNMIAATATNSGYTGTLHWKIMKGWLKHKILADHSDSLKALGLEVHIFPFRRGSKDKRTYYLKECPWIIGNALARFIDEKTDKLAIVSDNDFDSLAPASNPASRQPTLMFLERLIGKLASETAMEQHLEPKKRGAELSIKVKRKNVKPVVISGFVGSKECVEVQAADIVLGMYSLARMRNKRIDKVLVKEVG